MRLLIIVSLLAHILIQSTYADEGMWQPEQLPSIASNLKKAGLKLNPNDMAKLTEFPMGAIISLGGCTASFVSPHGLVVTNHHCAYGSIQYHSTEKNNLLQNGFLAKNYGEELQAAPGSRVYVTEAITNVTDLILKSVPENLSGLNRYEAIEKIKKAQIAECEKDKSYRCHVVTYHGGLEFYLFRQMMIRDVRLVYAPAGSIGKFGGDIDNWMWPRHTGDFSFLRAYVNANGKPADFSESNVPYQPKHYLKVNSKGVAENDYVMVLGYPGRTNRYRTAKEVEHTFTKNYPLSKQYREEFVRVIEEITSDGSDERLKYESQIASLNNYAKNYESMIKSYSRSDFQQRKNQLETDLNTWINQDTQRNEKYGSAIKQLMQLIDKSLQHFDRDLVLNYLQQTQLMPAANRLFRLAHESEKPDAERESGYQERDLKFLEQSMERIDRRYVPAVDQAVLKHFLLSYNKLPAQHRVASLDIFFGFNNSISEEQLDKKLSSMYKNTLLGNKDERLAWMKKPVAEFKSSKDPFIQLAIALFDDNLKLEKEQKQLDGDLQKIRPQFMAALIAYYQSLNKAIYADANSTLRITYGNVVGYSPQDGLYAPPFTTLNGILQKYTGQDPFESPAAQLDKIKTRQYGKYFYKPVNSVPVNFLSNLDITGGNSGSPTLNAKGELVGLVFDGVYESIIGDWDYNPEFNRSIHVDIRYMLWVMQELDHADNLLKEIKIIH